MTNRTGIVLNSELQARLAQGHNRFGEPTSNWDLNTMAGAGAIRSTVKDLLRFAAANLSEADSPIHRALRMTHKPQRTFSDDMRTTLKVVRKKSSADG